MNTDEVRVVLYSHDSQGLGHLRRNLALAHALARRLPALTGRPVTGLIVTGEASAPSFDHPDGFDFVVLPGIRKRSGRYAPRRLEVGMEQLSELREHVLEAALVGFAPHLVVIDRHPFGVNGELREGLTALRSRVPQAKVVLGLREVLDTPDAVAQEWAALGDPAGVRDLLDEIWVYGDETVHDLRRSGELPGWLSDLVHCTGYLSSGRPLGTTAELTQPYIVTMAGGGSDGLALTEAAAAADVPPGVSHIVVTGPQMAERDRRRVEHAAGPRTTVLASVPDGLALLRGASAAVMMGGYNTVAEAMSTDVPTLIVPRSRPRLEQTIRAEALARTGLFDHLAEPEPAAIGRWFAGAVGRRVARDRLNRRGLSAIAPRAADLLRRPGGLLDPRVTEALEATSSLPGDPAPQRRDAAPTLAVADV